MIRLRKLLILIVIIVVLFLITTNYLLFNLQSSDVEVKNLPTIEEKIYLELQKLPEHYKLKSVETLPVIDLFAINTNNITRLNGTQFQQLWKLANSWVSKTRIVDFSNPDIGRILHVLKVAAITKADLDTRGTQLKLLLTLQVRNI